SGAACPAAVSPACATMPAYGAQISPFPAARVSVMELAGVRVVRGDRTVLDVPALEVRQGEVLAVIGPNGAGKSTLLRVFGLLDAPTMGEVRFRRAVVTA